MRAYHFSLGNSTSGPIGFCARIVAKSEEEALQKLRDTLPTEFTVREDYKDGIEYIAVYFNPDAITVKDIDESEATEQ